MKKISVMPLFLLLLACSLHYISPEEDLLKSVKSYWQAVIQNRWGLAYEYEYPLLKKTVPRDVYISKHGNPLVRITNFEVEKISFENEKKAQVYLMLRLNIVLPGTKGKASFPIRVLDQWQNINGKWYHVPKKGKLLRQKIFPKKYSQE